MIMASDPENMTSSMYDHGDDIKPQDALKICADHMKGEWTQVSVKDFALTVIPAGFINRIFVCENKKSGEKLLLRLYGGKNIGTENRLRGGGYEHEVLAFYAMADNGIGPKLYGVFPGGRLEQFVNNTRIMTPDDANDKELMAIFAGKLAKIHSTRLPFSRTPKDYFVIIDDIFPDHWNNFLDTMTKRELPDYPEMKESAQILQNTDVKSLIKWYQDTEPKIRGKVTLCHGDLNVANCLIRDDASNPDQRLVLLDYEFTSYGYRGIDIGSSFDWIGFDVKQIYFGRVIQKEHPDEENRRYFVQKYLEHLRKIPAYDFNEETDNEYQILLEAAFYGPLYAAVLFSELVILNCEEEKSFCNTSPAHPIGFGGRFVKLLIEGKTRVMDLMTRGRLD